MSDTPMPQPTTNQAVEAPKHKVPSMTAWLFDNSMKLAIVTATLFITGWVYAGAFFDVFGLDIRTLEFPFYVSVVMAIRPAMELITLSAAGLSFATATIGGILAFASLLAVVFQEWYGFKLPGKLTKRMPEEKHSGEQATARSSGKWDWIGRFYADFNRLVVIAFAFLLFLASANWIGKSEGENYKQHPSIRACLNFKVSEKAEIDDKLRKANSDGKLRMLIQTKDLVVLFTRDENGALIVPRANLFSVRSQPIKSKTPPTDDATACQKGGT